MFMFHIQAMARQIAHQARNNPHVTRLHRKAHWLCYASYYAVYAFDHLSVHSVLAACLFLFLVTEAALGLNEAH